MDPLNELTASLDDVTSLLELAIEDPIAAAKILDDWADQLHQAAEQLRSGNRPNAYSDGGVADKVFARVFGPDGKIKSTGGTHRHNDYK